MYHINNYVQVTVVLVDKIHYLFFLASKKPPIRNTLYHRLEFMPFRIVFQWVAFIYVCASIISFVRQGWIDWLCDRYIYFHIDIHNTVHFILTLLNRRMVVIAYGSAFFLRCSRVGKCRGEFVGRHEYSGESDSRCRTTGKFNLRLFLLLIP